MDDEKRGGAASPNKDTPPSSGKNNPKRCGAKRRDGKTCLQWAVKGKNRCRMHGGTNPGAPKGSTNAKTHGFYHDGLLPDEQDIFDGVRVGEIDAEIRMARIRLRRLQIAERQFLESQANLAEGDPMRARPGMVVEEVELEREDRNAGTRLKRKERRTPYEAITQQALRTIANLEAIRSQLNTAGAGRDADVDEKALAARRAYQALDDDYAEVDHDVGDDE